MGAPVHREPGRPIPIEAGIVPFESPLLGWTVAAQYVRALYDCKIVSVAEELAIDA
ncbi:hypothetical protein [Streptomyces sp. Ag109_O5-1]|uniref:hypothetical protein n=1 Tax=Streptomyces sp. Ag109_O5-1 TaxID=1938851 RepID=UPI0021A72165|nr:hypothetical protein [Streptomyces sp. Ag109_O5-1]